jgi:hypothetical protein
VKTEAAATDPRRQHPLAKTQRKPGLIATYLRTAAEDMTDVASVCYTSFRKLLGLIQLIYGIARKLIATYLRTAAEDMTDLASVCYTIARKLLGLTQLIFGIYVFAGCITVFAAVRQLLGFALWQLFIVAALAAIGITALISKKLEGFRGEGSQLPGHPGHRLKHNVERDDTLPAAATSADANGEAEPLPLQQAYVSTYLGTAGAIAGSAVVWQMSGLALWQLCAIVVLAAVGITQLISNFTTKCNNVTSDVTTAAAAAATAATAAAAENAAAAANAANAAAEAAKSSKALREKGIELINRAQASSVDASMTDTLRIECCVEALRLYDESAEKAGPAGEYKAWVLRDIAIASHYLGGLYGSISGNSQAAKTVDFFTDAVKAAADALATEQGPLDAIWRHVRPEYPPKPQCPLDIMAIPLNTSPVNLIIPTKRVTML